MTTLNSYLKNDNNQKSSEFFDLDDDHYKKYFNKFNLSLNNNNDNQDDIDFYKSIIKQYNLFDHKYKNNNYNDNDNNNYNDQSELFKEHKSFADIINSYKDSYENDNSEEILNENNNFNKYFQSTTNKYDNNIYYKVTKRGPEFTPGIIILTLIILIVLLVTVVLICEKRKKKKTRCNYNYTAPVVVTSSTHMPANVGATYPVDGYQTSQPQYHHAGVAPYPMPQPAPVHTAVPYPTSNTGMPMPHSQYPQHQPPVGYPTPYPPAQNPQDVLPPSYDQVVSSTTIGPTPTPYNKQSPYNPHYTG